MRRTVAEDGSGPDDLALCNHTCSGPLEDLSDRAPFLQSNIVVRRWNPPQLNRFPGHCKTSLFTPARDHRESGANLPTMMLE